MSLTADSRLLQVDLRSAGYGAVPVLHDIAFDLDEGRRLVILGANGAGKTTTLRALTGLCAAQGSIRFAGAPLQGLPAHRIARHGIAHVPQGRGTVPDLTVRENLLLGGTLRSPREAAADVGFWMDRFPRLGERAARPASGLSGGEQQLLAIARAFMARPRLVLLDEPSLGLAPKVTAEVFAAIDELGRARGTALLIVEQNAALALAIADTALVLESGRIVTRGAAADLQGDDDLRRAYLGV
ncbi:ABC transporter ATP-binding protein [Microbacterium telephonicum]|uniref:Amino acid/amide ABC transporter ATP-binding protein 2 (HAAT family) n=1 Tax=Microbacterium telephonicum TaxID=1714841 RepID=A0A498BSK8_9MICO|nr:ABC transporter ATP-binding protein [Microbacterium telephonicum]RLK46705.1 amino acid/amide ABC transporter ATP-binding protein 2 (HAAT family) [Microbacterium telephonicum]